MTDFYEPNAFDNDEFYAAFPPLDEGSQSSQGSHTSDQPKDTEEITAAADVPLQVLEAAFNAIPSTKGIPSPKSRKVWLDFGYAAKEANPTYGGRAWDQWAQRDTAQYDGVDQAKTWATLAPSKTTRGTIFHAANKADRSWWRDGDTVEAWWKAQAKVRSGDDAEAEPCVDGATWPAGYVMRSTGLYYTPPAEPGEPPPDPIRICDAFKVLGRTSNEHRADHGLAIHFDTHEVIIPNELLHIEGGQKLAALLSTLGLTIQVGKIYRGKLQYALGNVKTDRTIRSVKTTGWHRTQTGNYIFMMPDKTFIGSDKDILLAATPKYRFTQRGTLEEWQDKVVRYATGNSRLTAFLCAAFHAPLLDMIPSAENSGLGLAGASRGGKTSALDLAASVWGRGDKTGCQQTWLATGVAMEYMATESCDCPLFLDEIQSADGRNVENMLYALGNGTGKARGLKDGGYREGDTWRIFLLSTGEMTPTDKVKEGTGKQPMDGMVARLPTVPSDAGMGMKIYENMHGYKNGAELSDQIRQQAIKYYGTAIRAFLERLVAERNDPTSTMLTNLSRFTAEFVNRNLPSNSDGIAHSVILSFARDAYAGQLAKNWGILPAFVDPTWALETCCTAYLAEGGKALDGGKVTVVKDVRRFLQAHGDSRFKDTSMYADDHAPIMRDLVGYRDKHGFYVLPEQVEVMGHTERMIAKALDADGFLRRDGIRLKVRKNLDGRQMTVYHIKQDILEGDLD